MPSNQTSRLNRPAKTSFDESLDRRESRRGGATRIVNGAILMFFAGLMCRYLGLLDLVPVLRFAYFTGVLFLVLGAWLGARHFHFVLIFTGAMALLLLIVAYTPLAKKMSRSLIVKTAPQEIARGADAVMVLGSWVQLDGNFTGPSLTRLLGGVQLVRQNRAPVLILSELKMPSGSYVKAAKKLAKDLNFSLNVQPLPGAVINTRDEAVNFAALAKSKGWKRVFLVTSPTHTRRATLMFRRAAQNQKLQVLPVPCMETDADLANLNDPLERIAVFRWCVREVVGIWLYQRRGWI